jgi:hypothetical protein
VLGMGGGGARAEPGQAVGAVRNAASQGGTPNGLAPVANPYLMAQHPNRNMYPATTSRQPPQHQHQQRQPGIVNGDPNFLSSSWARFQTNGRTPSSTGGSGNALVGGTPGSAPAVLGSARGPFPSPFNFMLPAAAAGGRSYHDGHADGRANVGGGGGGREADVGQGEEDGWVDDDNDHVIARVRMLPREGWSDINPAGGGGGGGQGGSGDVIVPLRPTSAAPNRSLPPPPPPPLVPPQQQQHFGGVNNNRVDDARDRDPRDMDVDEDEDVAEEDGDDTASEH